MAVSDEGTIANTPAGRLRDILAVCHTTTGHYWPSAWWRVVIAPLVTDGADGLSARADAASLFRDIELAVRALPPDDDPDVLLTKRALWAAPIFGIGHTDTNACPIYGRDFVDPEALVSLSHLHSILRREAPEYRARPDLKLIQRTLVEAHERLTAVQDDLLELGEALPSVTRARLFRGIERALDDIRFVQFRGYACLYQNLAILQIDATAASDLTGVRGSPGILERVNRVADRVKQTVAAVEAIFIPGSVGVSYGILTGDIVGAVALWVGARRALGPTDSNTEALALPPANEQSQK